MISCTCFDTCKVCKMGGSEGQVYKKLRSESGMKQQTPSKSMTKAWKSVLTYIKGTSLWKHKKCDTTKLLKKDPLDPKVTLNSNNLTPDIILRTYTPKPSHRDKETKAEIDKKFVVNLYRNSRRNFAKDTSEQIPDNNNVNRDMEEIKPVYDDKLSISARSSRKKVDRVTRQSTMEVFEKLENCCGEEALKKLRELDHTWSSKNSCDNPSKESGYNTEEDIRDSKPIDEDMKKLKEKAEVQSKIMKQAAKAIELCRGDPTKFRARVEAERILLISTCKYERLQQDISNSYYETPNNPGCLGTLVISNLRASLEEILDPSWFICTVSNNDTFHATKAVLAPPGATLVEFKEEFVFEGLHPDFSVRIQVFFMVQEKLQKSFTVQTLCRRSKRAVCRSSFRPYSSADVDLESSSKSGISSKAQITRSFKHQSSEDVDLESSSKSATSPKAPITRSSADVDLKSCSESSISRKPQIIRSFKPKSSEDVDLKSSSKSGTNPKAQTIKTFKPNSFAEVDLDSSSKSTITLNVQITQVKINQTKSGFVTITTDNSCSWSRRWCTLKDTKFSFWSYPGQEDTKPAEGVVDLEELLGDVVVADRSYCARSMTLMLRCPKRLVFLKFDTRIELKEWMEELNEVYQALKSWNLLRM